MTFHIAQIRPTFQRGVRTPAFFPCIVQFQPNDAVHRRFAATVHAQVKVTRIAFLIATFQCVTQFNPGIWSDVQPFTQLKGFCSFTTELQVLLFHISIGCFIDVVRYRAAAVELVYIITQGVIPVHTVVKGHLVFQTEELAVTACHSVIACGI